MPNTLDDWLSYIEKIHPKSIEMGLDRIRLVRDLMGGTLDCPVITVGGTNGKGSTAAMLTACYAKAGYRVGCYSSPHFLQYNERLTINGLPVSDAAFCKAFTAVENARVEADVALTYFEFGTLAAAWLMSQSSLDVAVLEVGLGGRLDAVNIFDADCAIVTNVALDHQDFLGDTRESIAKEKAGVYRTAKPAICGDDDPPETLLAYARDIGAKLKCIGQSFTMTPDSDGYLYRYLPNAPGSMISLHLPKVGLSGAFQANNAASALTAIFCMQKSLPINDDDIQSAIAQVNLTGRYERAVLPDAQSPILIYDVAHNPNAAEALSQNLLSDKSDFEHTIAVFSMLHNKDWTGVIRAVEQQIDVWYLGQIQHDRGANVQALSDAISAVNVNAEVHVSKNIAGAFQQALCAGKDYNLKGKNVRLIVFGSFFTVSEAKHFLQNQGV